MLESLDDFHRAQLGRSGHRTAWKSGPHGIQRSAVVSEFADNGTDQLMNGLVCFDLEKLWHTHRGWLANLANVISHEIDNHQILGALLGVLRELLSDLGIDLSIAITPAGAFDRL